MASRLAKLKPEGGVCIGIVGVVIGQLIDSELGFQDFHGEIITSLFIVAIAFGAFFLKNREKALKNAEDKLVSSLEDAKIELVGSVEDATRHTLSGIDEILHKALELIEKADVGPKGELYYINFAMNFGYAHTFSDSIKARYEGDFEEDVEKFRKSLHEKIGNVPNVKILTLNDIQIGNFVKTLKKRDDYKKTTMTNYDTDAVKAIGNAKSAAKTKMNSRDNDSLKDWDNDVIPSAPWSVSPQTETIMLNHQLCLTPL